MNLANNSYFITIHFYCHGYYLKIYIYIYFKPNSRAKAILIDMLKWFDEIPAFPV